MILILKNDSKKSTLYYFLLCVSNSYFIMSHLSISYMCGNWIETPHIKIPTPVESALEHTNTPWCTLLNYTIHLLQRQIEFHPRSLWQWLPHSITLRVLRVARKSHPTHHHGSGEKMTHAKQINAHLHRYLWSNTGERVFRPACRPQTRPILIDPLAHTHTPICAHHSYLRRPSESVRM